MSRPCCGISTKCCAFWTNTAEKRENPGLNGIFWRFNALALYPENVLGFVKETQDEQWQKFCALYSSNPEQKFLERVAHQLNKSDSNAADKAMHTFGTPGVLRHELRDRGTRFSLCQFRPEHELNPDTLAKYQQNRCRVASELVYSSWATDEY